MQFSLLLVSSVFSAAVPIIADPLTQLTGTQGQKGLVTGFASGLMHGAVSVGSGLVNTVFHPIQTIKGVATAVVHPIKTVKTAAKNFQQECHNNGGAECAGKATFEVAALALGPSTISAIGSKVSGVVSKGRSLGSAGIGAAQRSTLARQASSISKSGTSAFQSGINAVKNTGVAKKITSFFSAKKAAVPAGLVAEEVVAPTSALTGEALAAPVAEGAATEALAADVTTPLIPVEAPVVVEGSVAATDSFLGLPFKTAPKPGFFSKNLRPVQALAATGLVANAGFHGRDDISV